MFLTIDGGSWTAYVWAVWIRLQASDILLCDVQENKVHQREPTPLKHFLGFRKLFV